MRMIHFPHPGAPIILPTSLDRLLVKAPHLLPVRSREGKMQRPGQLLRRVLCLPDPELGRLRTSPKTARDASDVDLLGNVERREGGEVEGDDFGVARGRDVEADVVD